MPLSILCPGCGTGFGVETELAGRNLRCPACQSVFKAPNLSRENSTTGGITSVFDRDQFFINQKMLSLIERYTLLDANGAPLIHVERPAHYMKSCASIFVLVISIIAAAIAGGIAGYTTRGALGAENETSEIVALVVGFFAAAIVMIIGIVFTVMIYPKRHINMYSDKEKQHLILKVYQDQKFAVINHRFTVADDAGNVLGVIRKNMLTDIFRKAWKVYDAAGEKLILLAREDSIIKSMLRRLMGPMLGLLRTNFVLLRPNSEVVVGEFNRKLTLMDKYVLDLSADTNREVDRRLAVALAILLDTGERR